MSARIDTIAAALRGPELQRQFLGHELRGALVQGVGAGSTEVVWTATVPMLAEAIDTALTKAEEAEEKDIPTGTPSTPHALVLEADDIDLIGSCRCGRRIGRTPQRRSVDGLVGLWERHVSEDEAWTDALAALPTGGAEVTRG